MSTNNSAQQESYIHSLKQIKALEEKAQAEVDAHKRKVEAEMKKLDEEYTRAIEAAKSDGEKSVAESIENAQKKASVEADKIIKDAHTKAKSISSHLDIPPATANKIIEILLSGL